MCEIIIDKYLIEKWEEYLNDWQSEAKGKYYREIFCELVSLSEQINDNNNQLINKSEECMRLGTMEE